MMHGDSLDPPFDEVAPADATEHADELTLRGVDMDAVIEELNAARNAATEYDVETAESRLELALEARESLGDDADGIESEIASLEGQIADTQATLRAIDVELPLLEQDIDALELEQPQVKQQLEEARRIVAEIEQQLQVRKEELSLHDVAEEASAESARGAEERFSLAQEGEAQALTQLASTDREARALYERNGKSVPLYFHPSPSYPPVFGQALNSAFALILEKEGIPPEDVSHALGELITGLVVYLRAHDALQEAGEHHLREQAQWSQLREEGRNIREIVDQIERTLPSKRADTSDLGNRDTAITDRLSVAREQRSLLIRTGEEKQETLPELQEQHAAATQRLSDVQSRLEQSLVEIEDMQRDVDRSHEALARYHLLQHEVRQDYADAVDAFFENADLAALSLQSDDTVANIAMVKEAAQEILHNATSTRSLIVIGAMLTPYVTSQEDASAIEADLLRLQETVPVLQTQIDAYQAAVLSLTSQIDASFAPEPEPEAVSAEPVAQALDLHAFQGQIHPDYSVLTFPGLTRLMVASGVDNKGFTVHNGALQDTWQKGMDSLFLRFMDGPVHLQKLTVTNPTGGWIRGTTLTVRNGDTVVFQRTFQDQDSHITLYIGQEATNIDLIMGHGNGVGLKDVVLEAPPSTLRTAVTPSAGPDVPIMLAINDPQTALDAIGDHLPENLPHTLPNSINFTGPVNNAINATLHGEIFRVMTTLSPSLKTPSEDEIIARFYERFPQWKAENRETYKSQNGWDDYTYNMSLDGELKKYKTARYNYDIVLQRTAADAINYIFAASHADMQAMNTLRPKLEIHSGILSDLGINAPHRTEFITAAYRTVIECYAEIDDAMYHANSTMDGERDRLANGGAGDGSSIGTVVADTFSNRSYERAQRLANTAIAMARGGEGDPRLIAWYGNGNNSVVVDQGSPSSSSGSTTVPDLTPEEVEEIAKEETYGGLADLEGMTEEFLLKIKDAQLLASASSHPDLQNIRPYGEISGNFGTIYFVRSGDTLSGIAARYDIADWRSIWDAPENAQLKNLRGSERSIRAGDLIVIPQALRQASTEFTWVAGDKYAPAIMAYEANPADVSAIQQIWQLLNVDIDFLNIDERATDIMQSLDVIIASKEAALVQASELSVKASLSVQVMALKDMRTLALVIRELNPSTPWEVAVEALTGYLGGKAMVVGGKVVARVIPKEKIIAGFVHVLKTYGSDFGEWLAKDFVKVADNHVDDLALATLREEDILQAKIKFLHDVDSASIAKGGHAVSRHIGKTYDEVVERLMTEGLSQNGSIDEASAARALYEIMNNNIGDIHDFLINGFGAKKVRVPLPEGANAIHIARVDGKLVDVEVKDMIFIFSKKKAEDGYTLTLLFD